MTVISAAITKNDGIAIVGDSAITSDYVKDTDGYSKLWIDSENGFIFGGCGSIRAIQVIKHWTDWPYYRQGTDPEEFVIKEVIPRVRDVLLEHGTLTVSKRTETYDASFIMAWGKNLVVIEEDFSVTIPASGRYAIGSGQSEALGSLGSKGPWSLLDVVESASKASITAIGVGGPLWAVTTKSMEIKKIND